MEKIENTIINDVADTLYIPLAMRKKESSRKNPFFNDPHACALVDRIDYDFSKYNKAIRSSVGVAIRAKYFDELCVDFYSHYENPVIVNIGCGLDTRYQRLSNCICGGVKVYDLDLPEVIQMKTRLIPAQLKNPYLPYSMFDKKWTQYIKKREPNANFLFVIEGVLMYFSSAEVRKLFQLLSQQFPQSEIAFDVVSSWMCKNCHRHDTVKLTNAKFIFGCDNDRLFEKWYRSLRLVSSKRYNEFPEIKYMGLMNRMMMNSISFIRESSRMLHYRVTT